MSYKIYNIALVIHYNIMDKSQFLKVLLADNQGSLDEQEVWSENANAVIYAHEASPGQLKNSL